MMGNRSAVSDDLEEIERQVTGLNGTEFDAFIASMSDEELRT